MTRNCEALGSFLLTCATTELSLIAMWRLIGATPRGQPWTPAVTLPHGRDDLSARWLSRYEARWRQRLMPEIRTSRWFRDCLARLSNAEWDTLVAALASDGVQSLIKRKARFNWHSSLVLALVRQRGIKSLLLRSLIR